MSSHHIIRENQEAAIFLVNREAIFKEVLESFFEWSPLILTTEECFLLLNDWGFKVDAVICEIGFIENFETELAIQQPVEIIKVKNKSLAFKEGLAFLAKKQCPAVNIFINENPLMEEQDLDRFHMAINIIQGDQRGLLINNGLYEKWVPGHSHVRGLPLTNDQLFILKYSSDSAYKQKLNSELVINIDKEGLFSINSYQSFVIWEPI